MLAEIDVHSTHNASLRKDGNESFHT